MHLTEVLKSILTILLINKGKNTNYLLAIKSWSIVYLSMTGENKMVNIDKVAEYLAWIGLKSLAVIKEAISS